VTSPSVDDPETLRRILSQAEAMFLDFDGPICDVFAALPAQVVVDQLCIVLADGGYGDPPPEIAKSSDPFDVLKYAVTLGKTESEYVQAAFVALEAEAVVCAKPTPGAHDVVRAWSQQGRPLAVVSNNSKVAVEIYLDRHGIRDLVGVIAARSGSNIARLKPSPFLLKKAATELLLPAPTAVFVGDSLTDIEAAKAAGVQSIGYANKPGKVQVFDSAEADAVITRMSSLLTV
jgi:HAD superfamily hydrolase (TIGR01509 family)